VELRYQKLVVSLKELVTMNVTLMVDSTSVTVGVLVLPLIDRTPGTTNVTREMLDRLPLRNQDYDF
jgi:hypothetical protein